MEKRISFEHFQAVKRVAKACDPFITKKQKIEKQITELTGKLNEYKEQISLLEAGIREITGFGVEDLLVKQHEQQGGSKYVLKPNVVYDKVTRQYVVTDPAGISEATDNGETAPRTDKIDYDALYSEKDEDSGDTDADNMSDRYSGTESNTKSSQEDDNLLLD